MIRKSVLDKTGGFDERFFMYGEDIDLSYRIQKAGFKNLYFAESTIIHFKGESTKKDSPVYIKLFYGAMSLFVKKHYSGKLAGTYDFLIQIAIGIKMLISGTYSRIRPLFRHRKEQIKNEKCLLIGETKDFKFVESILQKNNIKWIVDDLVNPHAMATDKAVVNMDVIHSTITRQHIKAIVFCINDFSAKEVIGLMELFPAGLDFRFHFAGTFSIIGSNQKDFSGDCFS
jgi:hypothetical protein